jgi:hypothetical protein
VITTGAVYTKTGYEKFLNQKKSWSGRGIDTTLRLCVCVCVSIFHSSAILSSSLANAPFLPFFALWVAALTGEKMPSAD